MVLIASIAPSRSSIRRVEKRCGDSVWSITSIAAPSGVGQIAR
jgi:hypothetical protein